MTGFRWASAEDFQSVAAPVRAGDAREPIDRGIEVGSTTHHAVA
jgi:hypothetical protein